MKTLSASFLSARDIRLEETHNILQLHILFQGNMIRSNLITKEGDGDVVFDYKTSFSVDDREQSDPSIVIMLTTASSEDIETSRKVAYQAALDYRYADLYSEDYISVDLFPAGDDVENAHASGILFLRLTSSDSKVSTAEHSAAIERKIVFRQELVSTMHRNLLQFCHKWWENAQKTYTYLENRPIKLLSKDEFSSYRFVCSFVSPIKSPRSLLNPRFAARFVSLIRFKRSLTLTGNASEVWFSNHALLASLQGDVQEHAILLCGLLLGWGLDAYVAQGTINSSSGKGKGPLEVTTKPHYWVVTLDAVSSEDFSTTKITFWEPLTGVQYEVTGGRSEPHHFSEIYSMFRHNVFFANIQRLCKVAGHTEARSTSNAKSTATSLNLQDRESWAEIPLDRFDLTLLQSSSSRVLLADSDLSTSFPLEVQIEDFLRIRIRNWRDEHGVATLFDENLEQILQSALASFEFDRSAGVTFGDADFQAAIRRYVSSDECLKAYPTCFPHSSTRLMFQTLLRSKAFKDIALLSGRVTKLGLRVKVFQYPSSVVSVWFMFAVCTTKEP